MAIFKSRAAKNLGQILIIEDNIFMAELLAEKISNVGYEPVTLYDGREVMDKIAKDKPVLILLDLPLAGEVDGFDLLSNIRKSSTKAVLPVVVLFNLNQPEAISKSLKLGANYYLIKALTDTDEIVSKIGEVLQSKTREIPVEKIPLTVKEPVPTDITARKKEKEDQQPRAEVSFEVPNRIKAKIEKMILAPESEISIINLVDSMMEYSFLARASDIHLE